MKKLVFIGFIVLLTFKGYTQPCDKEIATDPNNPVNVPFATAYQNLVNPWLNIFDIGAVQSIAPLHHMCVSGCAAFAMLRNNPPLPLLTEKVEELTLYLLQQQKEIDALKDELDTQKDR